MYEGGIRSGARTIARLIFFLLAIVVVFSFIKVIMSHIGIDGTVTSSSDACVNEEAMSILERAGIFGSSRPRCSEEDKEKKNKNDANSIKEKKDAKKSPSTSKGDSKKTK